MNVVRPDTRPGSPDTAFHTERLDARPLRPGNEALLQWVFEQSGDYFLSITGRPEPDPNAARREVEACTATEGRDIALLTLRDGGDAIGAVGWWAGHPEPDLALLGMLLVVPEQRRRGLAREATDGLAAWAAEHGLRALRTGVGRGDAGTHALLRAIGFREMDQRTHVSLDRGRMMLALFERGTD